MTQTDQRIMRIRIPVPLIREMDTVILKGVGGYTTRAEFIVDAIQERILELSIDGVEDAGPPPVAGERPGHDHDSRQRTLVSTAHRPRSVAAHASDDGPSRTAARASSFRERRGSEPPGGPAALRAPQPRLPVAVGTHAARRDDSRPADADRGLLHRGPQGGLAVR